MTKYYIVYLLDSSKNFFLSAQDSEEETAEGKMLDHVMGLKDGDLGNYEIYEKVIG